jgi:valyl-tRNA synthetase
VNADARLETVLPLEGLLDVEGEKKRLAKEIEKSSKEAQALDKRLSSEGFAAKAPPEVVAQSRADLDAIRARVSRFSAALERLSS